MQFKYILNLLFHISNLRTGLFLSIMPTIYNLLINFYEISEKLNKIINPKFFTFLSGCIACLIGIAVSEKNEIMNYIILSVFTRCLHSILVVWLNKKKLPTQNKIASWFAIWLACLGVLFLSIYYPQYKPISKLVDRYALYAGRDQEEMNYVRESMRLRFKD
jgi:hypothetical protein